MTADIGIGTELAGYRVESLLRRGGMSVVYLAEDLRLGRKVVLKLLAPEIAVDNSFRDRFMRESRTAAAMDHPHIVPIYEAGQADGHLFIAMRYVRGTDLSALIASEGRLEPERTVAIVRQVASALDAAHAADLVHRDVKPANILLAPGTGSDQDHAYLGDFGITKRVSYRHQVTTTGQVMGSVDYIAPEQIEGREVDGRADVYSLGCVLYECLTGEVPYPRPNELAVLWAHVREPPPKVTALRPELPRGLDRVVAKAMAKEPGGRYSTAGALAADAAEAVGVSTKSLPQLPRRLEPRRRRRMVVMATLIAALATAAGVVFALRGGEPTAPAPAPSQAVSSLWLVDSNTERASPEIGVNARNPSDFAAGEGSLWVGTPTAVLGIDESDETVTRIPLQQPQAIAVGFGRVWVLAGQSAGPNSSLVQIDAAVGEVAGPGTDLGTPATALVVGPDAVWILSSNGELLRFDPVSGTIAKPIPVGAGASDLALGPTTVWVVNAEQRTLVGVPIATMVPGNPVQLPARPAAVASGEGAVWIVDREDGSVIPVDPVHLQPGDSIPLGGHPFEITTGNNSVWVASQKSVYRVPEGATAATQIKVHGKVLDLAGEHTLGRPDEERKIWVLVSNPPRQ